jgi:dolichol-phosphate mannosyltransferase
MQRVLVVVPTYMELATIEQVIRGVRAALPDGEMLIVDDNSPDGTADLAVAVGADVGGVHVLRRPAKTGLGDAYRAGLAWGLARDVDLFVTMDADLSHDPSAVPTLVDACVAGADVVIGSRYVPGAAIETGWPRWRRALSRWANRYVRLAVDTDVSDNTSGFRVYRRDLISRIQLDTSRADGYAFQIETVHRAASIGSTIREVPIVFTDRAAGRSKLSGTTIFEALSLVTWWGIRARTGRAAIELGPAGSAG